MSFILPYFKIIRIQNATLAGIAVFIGGCLSKNQLDHFNFLLLFISAVCATGFGNVINDIHDLTSDFVSHPERPLPKGEISITGAWIYTIILFLTSFFCSFAVSKLHGIATLIPITILIIYSFFLKGTPLIGNLVVASLVAYAILYGALEAPFFTALIIPAALAFLLNLSREIIKDIQDEAGDRSASIITSAVLPHTLLRIIVYCCSIVYLSILFIPYFKGYFGITYLLICILVILPLHIYRSILIIRASWKNRLSLISSLFKLEMLSGLIALLIDKILSPII